MSIKMSVTTEKVTLVVGASPNPDRFSFKAVRSLQKRDIPVMLNTGKF